ALARTVLPPELVPPVAGASVLRTTEAWGVLLGGRRPVAPEPFVPPSDDAPARSTRYAGPVGALVRDGNLWLALRRDQPSASIGSNHDTDLRIVDDPAIDPAHARLFRQGGRIYVEAAAPHSRVQVDGEQRDRWRLIGGERVTLGETRLQYQVFEDESRLPPPVNGVAVNAGPKADPRPSKPDAAAPRVEVAPKATEAKPESAKQEAKPESAKSEARSEPTPPRAEPRSEPPREPTPNPPNRAETPRPPSNRAVSPSSAPASGPSSPPPVSSSPVDPAASPGPSTTSSFRPASAGVSLDDHVDEWSPGWGPAEHEPARLLEPTAALRLDGLRDLTDDGDDELGSGELTVPLSAVAEAESANEEVTVQIPEGTSSDVPDDPNPDAETEPEPEPTPAESDERTEGVDELGDEPPSEEEVIQAVNGRVAHSAMIRMAHGEPVHEPQKLMTVMDDGSVETGPIPEDMLREALGMPPLGPLDEDVNPDLPTAPVWYQIDDGDSDDEDDEDGPVDDTTAVISRSDPANPDRVPTLIEASPPLQPHPTQPVFGFSGDVQDDDVSKLVAEPPKVARGVVSSGPTVVPVEREALPGRLPGATTSGSMPPQRAPSLPPGSIGRIPRTGTSLPPIGAGGGAGGEVTTPLQGRASLEFMSGPDRGKRITVGETVTVGQSRSCEISIPSDVRLSPVHCKIARTRDGFVVTDEGSANGTVVNGARITRFALHGGEVIVIGRTVLRFRVEGA
ncbi:MAG: FHA domain-containing protein, partial [Myxococcota bacterium]